MTALRRGLKSLIPERESGQASDIIEKIDSMEIVEEEPANVQALRRARTTRVSIENEDSGTSTEIAKKVAIVNEDDNEPAPIPAPAQPSAAVTPLTLDPASGRLVPKETKEQDDIVPALKESIAEPVAAHARAVHAKVIPAAPSAPAGGVVVKQMLGQNVEYVALGDIEANALQPRQQFDAAELEELASSLRQHGMLQPLVVTRKEKGGFYLVAGERRLRAAKSLGWDTVPCVVREGAHSDRSRLELALIENVQRQNLNAVEEAMGYQRLSEEYGMTHEDIGERVGRSRVGITNIIRLLQLPAEIQRGLMEGKISVGHAKAILMIPNEQKQILFYRHMVDEGLTVRKAESRARRIQRTMNLTDPFRKKLRGRPALGIKYDGQLEARYGHHARVKFDPIKNRFEVVFQAFNEGDALELLGRLLGEKPLPKNVDSDIIDAK